MSFNRQPLVLVCVFLVTSALCLLIPTHAATFPDDAALPRSLLSLLKPSRSSANAASSLGSNTASSSSATSTIEKATGLLELAQALVGKGDGGSSSLYIRLLKLVLNLFMDFMMDRMDRREDIAGPMYIPYELPHVSRFSAFQNRVEAPLML